MKRPEICKRERRGKVTYYCEIGGKQSGLGSDLEQAEVKYAELLLQHRTREQLTAQVEEKPASPAQSGLTVRAVMLAFLEWIKRNRAAGTHQFYQRSLTGMPPADAERESDFVSFDDYLVATGNAELLAADIDKELVTEWIDNHFASASDSYKHNLIRAVQAAFNWAMKQKQLRRQIGDNPLTGLEKPAQTPSDVYVTPQQWAAVVAELKTGPLLDFLTVCYETGCRPIEARLVTTAEFDREQRRWYFENPPKKVRGKKRPRIVLLNDGAMAICKRLAAANPTGALFRNERKGVAWTKSALDQACRRLSKTLGFKITPKSLRHSFATDLLRNDQSPVKVAALMGHRDATMLLTVYQKIHKCQDDLRAALAKRSPAA